MQSESYDIVAIMETWWDDSCCWSAVIDGYWLFKRDRQDGIGSGVALYVKKTRKVIAVRARLVSSHW